LTTQDGACSLLVMKLSSRITGLTGGGSDGWDVFYKARAMIADGIAVTELTIGEHDIRTSQDILDAMGVSAKGGHTGYAMVPGTDALRDTVARRIAERTGVPTTRDNILITPGGQAALFAAHAATCDQGDTALFIDPYYATYPGTIRGVGAVPVAVAAHPDDGFQPRASDIAAHGKDAVSFLINTPNNPTGAVYSPATLQGIADVCIANDLWLISDEVYDTQVWYGVPGYIQDAAKFALNQGTDVEEEVAQPFARRRAITMNALAGQNLIKAVPAQGAMYVMLDIRNTGMSGEGFANALLDTHLIAVMPGESFGKAAAGHIRVAMTIDDTAYEKALDTLIAFAQTSA